MTSIKLHCSGRYISISNRGRKHTHAYTHTQHNHFPNGANGCLLFALSVMALSLKSVKSIKNSRNMNWRVHYIIPAAFIWASGLFFIRPLEVKLRKAYLPIKHRTSLTPFWASFFAGTALLPSFFSSSGPFSASPCPFLSDWPSQWGYRAPNLSTFTPCVGRPMGRLRRDSLLSRSDIHPESLFSQPLTPGHGNGGRNVRSDWQDKECSLSLPHKRI